MYIDLNCDMGESFGQYTIGNDPSILPYITSSNIACGFHGGDPFHIENTIKKAVEHGVQVGAHPSYPDLNGFGRRYMNIDKQELKAIIKYQIAAIKGLVESQGSKLKYIKPHGALYNQAAKSESESIVIVSAIQEIDETLFLLGLAGSITEKICKKENIKFIAEAFADRKYESDGTLMSRTKKGSVIFDPTIAAAQVLSIILDKYIVADDGTKIPIHAQSICIHGDNPAAIDILKKLENEFIKHNIQKKSFG